MGVCASLEEGGFPCKSPTFYQESEKEETMLNCARQIDLVTRKGGWNVVWLCVCVGLSRRVARLFLVGLSLAGVEPVSSRNGVAVGFDLYSFGVMFCFMGMLPLFPLI